MWPFPLAPYGWSGLTLAHTFVKVETLPETDRTRYTITPAARKDLLKRLLAENHNRAAAEVAPPAKPGKPKSTREKAPTAQQELLL